MKLPSFFIGLLIGAAISFILMKQFMPGTSSRKEDRSNEQVSWKWPDSLDAIKAAPGSHKVLFENDKIRVLEVILEPHAFEPLHTHRFPSVMFGDDNDTSHFDIVYYPYSYDSARHVYFAKDSIQQHQGGKSKEANTANYMKPEGPHRVKNLSNLRIAVFRVEFKNDSADKRTK